MGKDGQNWQALMCPSQHLIKGSGVTRITADSEGCKRHVCKLHKLLFGGTWAPGEERSTALLVLGESLQQTTHLRQTCI